MNKSELVDKLAERYQGNRKAAQYALESVLDTITREVARGEKVAIQSFGSFEKRVRGPRQVRNPQTGETMRSKKTAVPAFRPGQQLKDVISGARKLPTFATEAPAAALGAVTGQSSAAKKSSTSSSSGGGSSTATKSSGSAAAKKSSSAAKKPSPQKKSSAAAKKSSSAAAKKSSSSTAAKSGGSAAKKSSSAGKKSSSAAKKSSSSTAAKSGGSAAKKSSSS